MADLTGTSVANNFEKVKKSQGLGARTQVINIAKTNITNDEMTSIVKQLAATYTIAGVSTFVAGTTDNVQIALQGTIDFVTDSSDAYGVTGAVSTLLADFDQK